jgi:hypothetical protein
VRAVRSHVNADRRGCLAGDGRSAGRDDFVTRTAGPVCGVSFVSPGAAGGALAGDHVASSEHQRGDLFGCRVRDVGQDRGVGVGGQHDAGMAEHLLHGPQVHARSQRQRGRAMPQVVQPDRRQPGLRGQGLEGADQPVGSTGQPLRPATTQPLSCQVFSRLRRPRRAAGHGEPVAPRRWCGPARSPGRCARSSARTPPDARRVVAAAGRWRRSCRPGPHHISTAWAASPRRSPRNAIRW